MKLFAWPLLTVMVILQHLKIIYRERFNLLKFVLETQEFTILETQIKALGTQKILVKD
jgi:hypothetical protein